MTPREIDDFISFYYLHPRPDLIARVIESLGQTKLLDRGDIYSYLYHQNEYLCVGFFAEVFAANPDRTAEWRQIIDRQADGDTKYWLRKAVQLGQTPALLGSEEKSLKGLSRVEENFAFLGAFCASGKTDYVARLIQRLPLLDDADPALFDAGGMAMLLLANNAPQHAAVRQALEAARSTEAPRTRGLINAFLERDRSELLQQIRHMDRSSPKSDHPAHARNHLPWRRPHQST